ncbi:MAG TPA: ANTAR domain-containing protein [Baekduia sp.]|nr:ANTAR domain-containing protein [Baekduia sp.]
MAATSSAGDPQLRVLIADEDRMALLDTAERLHSLGHEVISSAVDLAEATEAIAREDPDVSIVLVHADDEHALSLIEEIGEFSRGPVIALLADADEEFLRRAADNGIGAFARSTDTQAIQGAIDLALARHAEAERLTEQLANLQTALERRAVIERAKGMLMERHSLSEREAFERLRQHARSNNQRVLVVSAAVVEGLELDGG